MNFRSEAYTTILKVLKDKEYSDTLLHQRAKKLKNAGEDPALFYNLVKGVIKLYLKLDYILQQYVDKKKYADTDIKIKVLLYIGLYQLLYLNSIPDYAAVNETVELAKTLFNPQVATGIFINAVANSEIICAIREVSYHQGACFAYCL